jgi:uncharacterized membrane protein YesL
MLQRAPASIQVIVRAVVDWWDDWVSLELINLLWVLSWVTIILGPPATMGVYYVTSRLSDGEGLGISGFIEGSRRYFLQGWLLMLLNVVLIFVFIVNYLFYGTLESSWADVLKGVFLLLGIFWFVIQFYAIPYLLEQEEKKVHVALKNGLFTVFAAPAFTLTVFGISALLIVVSVVLIFPALLGIPCLIAMIGSRAVIDRLEEFGIRERKTFNNESVIEHEEGNKEE